VSEEERKDLIEEEKDDDVEAHRQHSGGMTEDADDGDGDDVEAHRQHGGVGRQHGGA
jgi:hypothetical protein